MLLPPTLSVGLLSVTGATSTFANGATFATTGGNVGINSSTPFAKLAVQGSADSNDLFSISSSTGSSMLRVNSAGQLLLNDSDNTLPAYSFVNDPDTGFYNNAGNYVAITTGGTVKLQVGTELVSSVNFRPNFTNNNDLGGYSYSWKDIYASGTLYVGMGTTIKSTTSTFATAGGVVGIGTTTPLPGSLSRFGFNFFYQSL